MQRGTIVEKDTKHFEKMENEVNNVEEEEEEEL